MAPLDYDKLETLLLSKAYSALDSEERHWVHQSMTEADYEAQRTLLLNTKAISFPVVPSGDLGALQQLYKERYNAPHPFWKPTFALWQTALIAVLSGVIVYCFFSRKTSIQTTKEVVVHTVDTLWQEKIIYQPKVVYQTKILRLPSKIDTVFVQMPIVAPLDTFFLQEQSPPKPPTDQPQEGKSMKGRRALWDLMANN